MEKSENGNKKGDKLLSSSGIRDRGANCKRLEGWNKTDSKALKIHKIYFQDVSREGLLNITLIVMNKFKEENKESGFKLSEMQRFDKKKITCLYVFIDENYQLLEPYFIDYSKNGIPNEYFKKPKRKAHENNQAQEIESQKFGEEEIDYESTFEEWYNFI